MTGTITDEMIMALADGQLPAKEAETVQAAVSADPQRQAKFEAYKQSQRVLTEGFSGLLERHVPAAMQQLVLGQTDNRGGVVSLADIRARKGARPWFGFLPQAAAAAVLVSAAAVSGYQAGQNEPAPGGIVLAGLVPAGSALQDALSTAPAGASVSFDGAEFVAVATYRADDGEVCREFELNRAGSGTAGLACRIEGGWQIEVAALNVTGGASGQFLPASADAFELVGTALDAKSMYDSVDPALEACILGTGECSVPD